MALAPFFQRAAIAAGRHLAVTPASLDGVLGDSLVEVWVGSGCRAGNDHWTAELLVNLLARLYPRLSIHGDKRTVRWLSDLALAISPNIELEATGASRTVCVALGGAPTGGLVLTGAASGWVATCGWAEQAMRSPRDASNPYSAGAVASLLAGEVFREMFSDSVPRPGRAPTRRFSLLDFREGGEAQAIGSTSLGTVAAVGLGAVGSAAAWAWARHPDLQGELHLVEPQELELSNLQRYVLPRFTDVGRPKVDIVESALARGGLRLEKHRCDLATFAGQYAGSFAVPTVCVSVDNAAGRREAQALLPRLVLNGWTSDTGLGASWHRLGRSEEPCLACLYHPDGVGLSQTELVARALGLAPMRAAELWIRSAAPSADDLKVMAAHLGTTVEQLAAWGLKPLQEVYSDLVCGSAALQLPTTDHAESVPLAHQSVMAGILMAAEAVKRTSAELEARSQRRALAVWDDVLRPAPTTWEQPRARHARCICGDQDYLAAYRNKWG